MRLVIGLGNPTARYADTRHNVGFRVVDRLAARWGSPFRTGKYQTLTADGRYGGAKVTLVKPQTYMNCSGEAVGALAHYFDVPPAEVFVVYDDIDLPLGQLRLRAKGSAGTHNGMRSVVQHLGTTEFPRLRVGIGRADRRGTLSSHVLGRFATDEQPTVERAIDQAVACVECVLDGDWDRAMNTYNERRPSPPQTTEREGS